MARWNQIAAVFGFSLIAVAHSLVVIIYHVLSRGEYYKDLGGDYFNQLDHTALQRRALRQLEGLGYKVSLEKVS